MLNILFAVLAFFGQFGGSVKTTFDVPFVQGELEQAPTANFEKVGNTYYMSWSGELKADELWYVMPMTIIEIEKNGIVGAMGDEGGFYITRSNTLVLPTYRPHIMFVFTVQKARVVNTEQGLQLQAVSEIGQKDNAFEYGVSRYFEKHPQ